MRRGIGVCTPGCCSPTVRASVWLLPLQAGGAWSAAAGARASRPLQYLLCRHAYEAGAPCREWTQTESRSAGAVRAYME